MVPLLERRAYPAHSPELVPGVSACLDNNIVPLTISGGRVQVEVELYSKVGKEAIEPRSVTPHQQVL